METVKNKSGKAEEFYKKGLDALRKGDYEGALLMLTITTKISPSFKNAERLISEIKEGLKWTAQYFCPKCGKFIEPESTYPLFKISEYCPNCGTSLPTKKENLINFVEISIKLLLFGIFPILLLIFCGIPYPQITQWGGISIKWTRLSDGIFSALSLTPLTFLFLLAINDPEGNILGIINWKFNSLGTTPAYYTASALLLFFVVYLYFLLLLTPIVTMHRKNEWMKWRKQKRFLGYSIIFTSLILIRRALAGIFY